MQTRVTCVNENGEVVAVIDGDGVPTQEYIINLQNIHPGTVRVFIDVAL